ncbi:CMT1A duplicated region transcript 4 protein [Psammomys obesus]|uniref:CMT1A duplicated region transcript 4 protein n=1 Tax=Psammomys obesus TaxID=48139 RepID=UPI00245360FB|nr:CMT1A duplicated region transcript 4 protein [Psammomys obesus]
MDAKAQRDDVKFLYFLHPLSVRWESGDPKQNGRGAEASTAFVSLPMHICSCACVGSSSPCLVSSLTDGPDFWLHTTAPVGQKQVYGRWQRRERRPQFICCVHMALSESALLAPLLTSGAFGASVPYLPQLPSSLLSQATPKRAAGSSQHLKLTRTRGGLTENNELPLTLLEKHDPWPAYVTYTCPAVKRLLDKRRAREMECMLATEESCEQMMRLTKPSSIQLKRKKTSKTSGDLSLKDGLSETLQLPAKVSPTVIPRPTQSYQLKRKKTSKTSGDLSMKDDLSETLQVPDVSAKTNVTFIPISLQSQLEAREGPTFTYNKIIFSRRPAMRKLPYGLLQTSKETHAKV